MNTDLRQGACLTWHRQPARLRQHLLIILLLEQPPRLGTLKPVPRSPYEHGPVVQFSRHPIQTRSTRPRRPTRRSAKHPPVEARASLENRLSPPDTRLPSPTEPTIARRPTFTLTLTFTPRIFAARRRRLCRGAVADRKIPRWTDRAWSVGLVHPESRNQGFPVEAAQ